MGGILHDPRRGGAAHTPSTGRGSEAAGRGRLTTRTPSRGRDVGPRCLLYITQRDAGKLRRDRSSPTCEGRLPQGGLEVLAWWEDPSRGSCTGARSARGAGGHLRPLLRRARQRPIPGRIVPAPEAGRWGTRSCWRGRPPTPGRWRCGGDTSGQGGDHSAADLALCPRLAWYTRDPDQLDRLFRRSGLYRPKWERADYRRRTLARVLGGSLSGVGGHPPHCGRDFWWRVGCLRGGRGWRGSRRRAVGDYDRS